MSGELDVLARAHALFGGAARPAALGSAADVPDPSAPSAGSLVAAYRHALEVYRTRAADSGRTDAALLRLLAGAAGDHDEARHATAAVLAAARADTAVPDNPIAAREMLRRRTVRLRMQRRHVLAARRRARRRRAALLALRYGSGAHRGRGPRADRAVRAALTRLGLPYVWGATGPDRFDCSGLVKWAYAQAGVPLRRTTYEQILDGLPVPRSQVRPGDLVFPHAGHVQMAIGHNLVVEAPHAGATVRISALGTDVIIRRPV
ncbi:MAG: NlpC/P60 family protein [Mycobacterium sp.]|nr:NlpC/P60 family protein [Mycobacterium sp.]